MDLPAVAALRERHYNATVVRRLDLSSELYRIHVRPDAGFQPFRPGQYTVLGLGNWEPRVQPSQQESLAEDKWDKVVKRAYSISCPLLDDDGHLVTCNQLDYLEFYVTLIRGADDSPDPPPALTPRLFGLQPGDRLQVGAKITGAYTLENIAADDTVLLIGTGTGEAPHNAMTAHLLASGHRGKIIQVTTVRYRADLGYLPQQAELMDRFDQYRYFAITTREPENLDASHPGFVGKQYVQGLFASGQLAQMAGVSLTPETTHVFLCGNPAMIGYVPPGAEPLREPAMLQILQAAGFNAQSPGCGFVRFEKYW